MLSVPQMRWLMKHAMENNSRVLLAGDSAQHGSVERGDALRILEQSGAVRYVELLRMQATQQAYGNGSSCRCLKRPIDVRLNGRRKNKCFPATGGSKIRDQSSQRGVERILDSILETQNLDAVEKRERSDK